MTSVADKRGRNRTGIVRCIDTEYSLVSLYVFYEIIGPCSLDLGWMGLESLCHWSPGLHTNGEWWD